MRRRRRSCVPRGGSAPDPGSSREAIVRVVTDVLRVACVQLTAGPDKGENVAKADVLVERAAAAGARLVLLPEKWNGVGNVRGLAEPLDGGETVAAMAGWARRHGLWL